MNQFTNEQIFNILQGFKSKKEILRVELDKVKGKDEQVDRLWKEFQVTNECRHFLELSIEADRDKQLAERVGPLFNEIIFGIKLPK